MSHSRRRRESRLTNGFFAMAKAYLTAVEVMHA